MDRIEEYYNFLAKNRGAKKIPCIVKDTSKRRLSNRAFPEISNRGQDESLGSTDFLTLSHEILTDLAGEDVSLADVYTKALLLDAKFTYSTVLEGSLRNNTDAWIPRVIELEYVKAQDPHGHLSAVERMMQGL